jgi:hypothetical protein
VTFLEKLTNDPDCGPWTGSPLARAALGCGFLFFALQVYFTGAIRIGKTGDGVYIHFADHPKTFVMTIALDALAAAWAFSDARRRYRLHGSRKP